MSRPETQQRYRMKRKLRGLCQRCKNKRMKGKVLCMECTVGRRVWQRRYIGSSPRVRGGRGRPIKYKLPEPARVTSVSITPITIST